MHRIRLTRCAGVLTVVILAALAGCGRRGALEPPPEAGVSAHAAREPEESKDGAPPESVQNNRRVRGVVPPKDPFVLDPLL